jgi:serine/threonine protein kinase
MLGRGSFGEVYEAIDTFQDAVVALKLVRRLAPTAGPWREAQLLTQLRSDYILPVWNADLVAGIPYLVTELARHGTAGQRMAPLGVPPPLAVHWVRAACRGAARSHDAGLLHCDIKAENLFLDDQDHATLGDFGLASLMDASGLGPAAFGTPVTMAPEVAAGGRTSVRSDVYSLGATLYALLAGRYGHSEPDARACMAAVVAGGPLALRDLAPHVPQALAQRVDRAMARDAADRYSSPAEFDAALGHLPASERAWCRTDEHAAHVRCWRGEAPGTTAATVCAVAAGSRMAVEARHQPTGRVINAACRPPGPPSQLPTKVRSAIAAVG